MSKMTPRVRIALAAFVAFVAIPGVPSAAEATELRIRVPQPVDYSQPVRLTKAQLLLAWWGDTKSVPLRYRYEANTLVVTVPLDREVWTSLEAEQPPDFGYVYLEFNDFVPVRSERFYWLGGVAPAPPPVNWETVTVVRFGFRRGAAVDIRSGEQRDVSLTVRRPVAKRLHILDDVGLPLSDITVDAGVFWSAHNHCGRPTGVEPLFANLQPNPNGTLAVPDGEFEYRFQIGGRAVDHTSIVEPPSRDGRSFTAFMDTTELMVRVRRHRRVPLSVRVSVGGKPAADVMVGASVPYTCGASTGPLGRTDSDGRLRLPDFYPEEFVAICIGNAEGHPLWAGTPPDDGALVIDLPAGAEVGDVTFCYLK